MSAISIGFTGRPRVSIATSVAALAETRVPTQTIFLVSVTRV